AQAKRIEQLQFPGVLALPYQRRYDEQMIAKHIVGFTSKDPERVKKEFADEIKAGTLTINSLIGASGIERSFQPFLQGAGPASISYFVDGQGYPLNGLTVLYREPNNSFYPLSVVTTIDYDFQKEAEQIMNEVGIKDGALVLLDAKSADVLAMVSRPDYNPERINLDSDGWVNRAVEQTIPGSIFKTVIAAAALNEGIVEPQDRFECKGDYGQYKFSCWKEGGHGHITMAEGFAQSCNIVFGELAAKLGSEKIQEYATKLGVTFPVGWETDQLFQMEQWKQLDSEDPGVVFAIADEHINNDKGNLLRTGIGQQDVQMTPLQAANLIVTILNDGQVQRPRLVSELQYRNGSTFQEFAKEEIEGEEVDRYTTYLLQQMMRGVVDQGTGTALKDTIWSVAGKTGTAQLSNGNNNQWFIGYGDVRNPKYVIAVVAKNVPSNEANQAIKAFEKMMNKLANYHTVGENG
ncbi:MAG: penicillin-binding protein 2, partial [Bacilli bacterium]